MSPTSRDEKDTPFTTVDRADEYCRGMLGGIANPDVLGPLIETSLLPVFQFGSERLLLMEDLACFVPVLSNMVALPNADFVGRSLFSKGIPPVIPLFPGTRVDLVTKDTKINRAFYAATRNLVSLAHSFRHAELEEKTSIAYFPPTRVYTASSDVRRYVDKQRARAKAVDSSSASQFANSAYYMGSKRALAGFLVEALSSDLSEDGVVVDLMCGSGAAAGAFGKLWRTIASDAQEFCRILAVVQGGGFSTREAASLLDRLLPAARSHAADLSERISVFLRQEDKFFHSDVDLHLLDEYRNFLDRFSTYPNDTACGDWDPVKEVRKRKQHPRLPPYCLFTSYFANVYFGLRQCVEIDSLRFAIDQIGDQFEKVWALGALIATLSALGTTYAGHFAQPLIKGPDALQEKDLAKILERRTYSIMHEFTVRLLNLSGESERSPRPVEVIAGPWSEALSGLDILLVDKPVAVYLDAPYKREEYSRYYHVLETLVSYSYPSCVGRGKIPDKLKGERFASEFFTKSTQKLTNAFESVILEILRRGWICAWSYSDSGDADIVTVANHVSGAIECKVKSYAVPYEHKAQGGRRAKKITEYLILFIPQKS